jgi:hypothetical protein
LLGTTKEVEKDPPEDVVTAFEPVGVLTVMLAPAGKYDP